MKDWTSIVEDGKQGTINKIEYSKNLYYTQKKKVEQEKYIENLLFADYVDRVKANESQYDYVNLFYDAQKEVGKKLKKEREHLEILKKFVMKDFLNNDKNFKLTNILSGGYECYYWSIHFKGYGKTFYIQIPIMRNINVKNFEYANYGKFAFVLEESECYLHTLKSSYKIEDIAQFVREYFELDKGVTECLNTETT